MTEADRYIALNSPEVREKQARVCHDYCLAMAKGDRVLKQTTYQEMRQFFIDYFGHTNLPDYLVADDEELPYG